MNQKFISSLLSMALFTLIVAVLAGIRPSIAAPAGENCPDECHLYMPFHVRPLNLDFTVTDIEIFQASQTDNNSIPLVAGKAAVARIYAQLLEGTSPAGVTVSLTAVRNGSTLGSVNAVGPSTVPNSPQRGSYNSTFNAVLPDGWLSGQVQLTATVDAAHAVPESNESNNQFGRIVTFNNIPDLQVILVPIDYTHQGPANPGFYPGQGIDNISDWVRRAYPIDNVNVTIRTPHDFSGNLQDNSGAAWVTLLDQIFTLKIGDGLAEDTPVVYYGLIPVNNGSTQWFTSGIAGIGWISPPGQNFREALGLNLGTNDETGILAGHEIGHNLGRQHAPCGGPASPDALYPYSGASIGQYGTDIRGNTVSLNTPTSHVDVMSYCSPEWVSDYTYTALYNNQRTQGLSQPAETGERLIIRATFTGNNEVTLAPSYAFPIKSSNELAASEVMVELLEANGEVIAAYPVNVRKVEEEGITFRSVMGTVPLPDVPAASLRLVEDGVILAERQFEQPARLGQAALAVTQTAEAVTLNWGLPDLPALVRYTADNGQSWTTLAVDALGGSFSTDIAGWMGESGRFEIILANTGTVTTLSADWSAQ